MISSIVSNYINRINIHSKILFLKNADIENVSYTLIRYYNEIILNKCNIKT